MTAMILVIDVGNTNMVMGVFDGQELVKDWRIRTERNMTEDEFHVLVTGLFSGSRIPLDAVEKTVISSVVPPMAMVLEAFCRKYLGKAPRWVNARTAAGMPILYDNPAEVGADRIVNAVAAFHKYRTALIVVDFGTATTFDAISAKGAYLGGAISPGIVIASEALYKMTSKLPRVELVLAPPQVIGRNTENSIKSGIIYGYAALVDGMVRRMKAEMGTELKVIATGGLAVLMRGVAETIEAVEPDLTLRGLRIISEQI